MSGVISLGGRQVYEEELHAMGDVRAHRGPDGEGFYMAPGVGLGMRRLSIIDLETGNQPIGNEDGTVWVVMNGEIYNFQSLRQELLALGHSFSSATDTEVIVHLYEELGARCVEPLRGMSSFAVSHVRRRRVLAAHRR